MSPIRTPKSRKLVLGRETVRALTGRPYAGMTLQPQEMSSCGEQCGCTDQMQTY